MDDKVIIYSTGCPNCKALKIKLQKSNIQYEEINDLMIMEAKGFQSVPMLEVNDTILNFTEAKKLDRRKD